MTSTREVLVASMGEALGNKMADDMEAALARAMDEAVFYGADEKPPEPEPEPLSPAQRLGLQVAAAYAALEEDRDDARRTATEAIGLLSAVVDTIPVGTFAVANTAVDHAREWLAAVGSPQTPEQENTQP